MILDNPIVTGSLNVQNAVTASNISIAATASAAYFTGSFIGDGTQLSGVTSYTDGDTLDYINSLGVLSGSAQIASDISGSFTSLSSSLEQRITAQEGFSQSLDATFATDQELSNVSGALALSISNISTDFADITNKPTLISSSAQFTDLTAPFTGSFTGSFIGDGSQLSGVTSYTDADTLAYINSRAVLSGSIAELTAVTASFLNTGSVTIPHSFNSKNVSVSVYDSNDILIIPQEIALISNSAVKLTFGGSTSGFAVVSKGGHIVSGSVPVPQLSTVTSAFTSTTSHTVTHNFNTKEVIVSVYENDSLIIPDTVTTDDVNNVTVTFPEAISGRVVVVKAGHIVSGSIPFDNLLDSPFSQDTGAISASKHIVPTADQTYDLGSPTQRFRDLYLSSASIYLGNKVISEDNVVTTASLQSVLPSGTLSGSAQIASDISGSFTLVSASIASERLKNTTDTLDGDLTVTGKITAQEFHTEFVSASILYDSGSTQFGNSADDIHIFSGSVLINASGSTSPDLKLGPTFNFSGKSNDYLGQIGWNRNVTTGEIFDSNYRAHQIHNYQGNLNHQIYAENGNFVTAHSYDSTGNIGFGIGNGVTPRQRLDIRGKLIFGGTGTSYYGQPGNFDTGSNGDKIILYSDSGTSYNGTIGVGSVANLWLKSQGESPNEGRIDLYTGGSLSLRVDGNGHIGIGTTEIGAKLSFKNEVADRKIALYTVVNNDYQFYGFGIADNTLIYHTAATSDDHVFYAGTSATTRSELARISGTGNLTVSGTTTTASPLTVQASSPYIQWKNSAGTRLGYIQHNETNLVMSVDTGDIVLDGRVGIGTNPSLSGVRLHTYNNSTDAYNIFESSANKWVFGEAGGVCQIGGLYGVHSGINIKTNGYVGIGETSPVAPLHVKNSGVYHINVEQSKTDINDTSAYATYYIRNNAGSSTLFGYFGAGGNSVGNTAMRNHIYYGSQSNHGVRFFTNDTAKMTIEPGGNVGIGLTNPGKRLQVKTNTIAANGGTIEIVRGADRSTHQGYLIFNSDGYADELYIGTPANSSEAIIGARWGDLVFQTGAYTERMRITTSGAVTKPNTPAFLVDGSFAHTGGNWLLASSSYTRVKYNIGSHFNTSNGRFTAPVAGRYMFFAGGYSPVGTANKRYAYNVRINGGTIEHITGGTYTGDADSPMAAHSIVVNLNANDYVELYIFSIIAATIGNSSHEAYFGGYLLG